MKFNKCYLIPSIFLLLGCSLSIADEETRYYQLASALTKLSSAVEAMARYENIHEGTTSDEIVRLSVAHDMRLLEPFDGYKLLVKIENRHAIVLVCDLSATEVYLEDAGCTKELDMHYWKTDEKEPCSPSINIAKACNN